MAISFPFTSAILLADGMPRSMGTLKALLDRERMKPIIYQIVAPREAGAERSNTPRGRFTEGLAG